MFNFIICSAPDVFSNLYGLIEKYFMNFDVSYKCHYCSNYREDLDKYINKDLECRVYIFYGNIDKDTYYDAFKKVRDEYGDWASIIIVMDSTNTYKYSVYSSGYNIFRYISESDNYIENINYTLDKCIKFYDNRFNSLKIKHYNYVEFVLYNDIIYIEKVKDSKTCIIKTIYGDKYYTGTLSKLYEKLKYNNFIKIHQSFIVNKKYLDEYIPSENIVKLKNSDDVVGVSRNHKKELKEFVNNK